MTFRYPTATKTISATGINNIDALLHETQWQSSTITFSFTSSFANDYESNYRDSIEHSSSFESLNADQRTVARHWFDMYEDVALLNTVELRGAEDRDATIRIAESEEPETAFVYTETDDVEGGDIWFNREYFNDPIIGNYAFIIFGHEIGHALGLKHGHERDSNDDEVSSNTLFAYRNSMEFSIMTYRSFIGDEDDGYTNEDGGYAQSLMMYDIRAVQEIYGANFDTNSGNTTYRFSPTTGEMVVNGIGQGTPEDNRIFRTIWDGNGIDTYDFSNYNTILDIDLRPGGWSDLSVGSFAQKAFLGDDNSARGHVFNALQYNSDSRSLIENAIGGSSHDSINGNKTANVLIGAAGLDEIIGGSGNDLIYGDNTYNYDGGETDLLYGNSGDDTVYGGGDDDLIEGNTGNDLLWGDGGDDIVKGGSGLDTVYGGTGSDIIYGDNTYNYDGGSADTLYGEEGNDTIYGGGGKDFIQGNADNDLLWGDGGDDTVIAGSGLDKVYGGTGSDVIYGDNTYNYDGGSADTLNGEEGNDTIYGGGGNDFIQGNAGKDFLEGEGGDDDLIGGSGSDTVYGGSGDDFLKGSDLENSNSSSEYDKLVGGLGADIFSLGGFTEAYYQGYGYATIVDFNPLEGDIISVFGSSSSYSLEFVDWNDDSLQDTIVRYKEDVIAAIESNNTISLDVNFAYLGE